MSVDAFEISTKTLDKTTIQKVSSAKPQSSAAKITLTDFNRNVEVISTGKNALSPLLRLRTSESEAISLPFKSSSVTNEIISNRIGRGRTSSCSAVQHHFYSDNYSLSGNFVTNFPCHQSTGRRKIVWAKVALPNRTVCAVRPSIHPSIQVKPNISVHLPAMLIAHCSNVVAFCWKVHSQTCLLMHFRSRHNWLQNKYVNKQLKIRATPK